MIDISHLKPFAPFAIAIGVSFGCLMTTVGVPGFSGKEIRQHDAGTKTRGSVFGAAAQMNLTFDEDEAAKACDSDAAPVASDMRYAVVKYLTWAIDYALIAGTLLYLNDNYSGENWTPENAVKLWYWFVFPNFAADGIKCVAFADVLCAKKVQHCKSILFEFLGLFTPSGAIKTAKFMLRVLMGEGLWRNFADKAAQRRGVLYHLFYFIKNAMLFIPAALYTGVILGWFTFDPLFDTAFTIEVFDLKVDVPNIVNAWIQFIILSFIKDTICMNVLHQIMHRRWYELHYVHHLPMVECCNFNMTYFDFADIILENVISPFMLLGIQFCFNPNAFPTINICSYVFLAACDANVHSLDPYTICFYNPILDDMFKATISHNLHHALNTSHYTVWPLHQLPGMFAYDSRERKNDDGSTTKDWKTYNRVMKTNFPEGR